MHCKWKSIKTYLKFYDYLFGYLGNVTFNEIQCVDTSVTWEVEQGRIMNMTFSRLRLNVYRIKRNIFQNIVYKLYEYIYFIFHCYTCTPLKRRNTGLRGKLTLLVSASITSKVITKLTWIEMLSGRWHVKCSTICNQFAKVIGERTKITLTSVVFAGDNLITRLDINKICL